jgi:hypothetical protein
MRVGRCTLTNPGVEHVFEQLLEHVHEQIEMSQILLFKVHHILADRLIAARLCHRDDDVAVAVFRTVSHEACVHLFAQDTAEEIHQVLKVTNVFA